MSSATLAVSDTLEFIALSLRDWTSRFLLRKEGVCVVAMQNVGVDMEG